MRIVQTDDRFELLSILRVGTAMVASEFMFEHGWDGDRFRAALKGIRKMRIALVMGDDGETVRVRRRCGKRARVAAEAYYARTYNA